MDSIHFRKSEEEKQLDRLFREGLNIYGELVYAAHQGAVISFSEEAFVVIKCWISAKREVAAAHIKRQLQTKAGHAAALGLLWALPQEEQKKILTQEFSERLYRLAWYEGIEEIAVRCGIEPRPMHLLRQNPRFAVLEYKQ